MTYTFAIPDWHPTTLNRLLGMHWAKAQRLKRADADMIAAYALAAGIPKATSKRRVSMLLTLTPGQRRCDPDAYWKSTLDALVRAGLLRNDSPSWCELEPLQYNRGPQKATAITLTDVEV